MKRLTLCVKVAASSKIHFHQILEIATIPKSGDSICFRVLKSEDFFLEHCRLFHSNHPDAWAIWVVNHRLSSILPVRWKRILACVDHTR